MSLKLNLSSISILLLLLVAGNVNAATRFCDGFLKVEATFQKICPSDTMTMCQPSSSGKTLTLDVFKEKGGGTPNNARIHARDRLKSCQIATHRNRFHTIDNPAKPSECGGSISDFETKSLFCATFDAICAKFQDTGKQDEAVVHNFVRETREPAPNQLDNSKCRSGDDLPFGPFPTNRIKKSDCANAAKRAVWCGSN